MKLFFLVSYIVYTSGATATVKIGPLAESDCWEAQAAFSINSILLEPNPDHRKIRFDCVPAE